MKFTDITKVLLEAEDKKETKIKSLQANIEKIQNMYPTPARKSKLKQLRNDLEKLQSER